MKPKSAITSTAIVKQPAPPTEEIAAEVLATAIVEVADAVRRLRSSRLNEKALLLLIQHSIPSADRPTTKQIKSVLDAAERLKEVYLRK
jgi:hypothetical protein